jgi:hypothetical protein
LLKRKARNISSKVTGSCSKVGSVLLSLLTIQSSGIWILEEPKKAYEGKADTVDGRSKA